jgi:hypothetical protein
VTYITFFRRFMSGDRVMFVYRVGTTTHLKWFKLGRRCRNRTIVWGYASVNSMRGSRRRVGVLMSYAEDDLDSQSWLAAFKQRLTAPAAPALAFRR